MRLAAFTSAMLVCGLVLVSLAQASHPQLIVLGKSLGPAKLGMTEPAVIGALGKPRTVLNTNYGGKPIRVARYTVHAGLFEVTYDRKSRRVVGLGTTSSYFKTAGGLGRGTPIAKVRPLGFRFSQCTANWERLVGGVLVSFIAGGPKIESVYMIRPA